MPAARSWYRACLILLLFLPLGGCRRSAEELGNSPPSRTEQLDTALKSAVRYLVANQQTNGSWTSETYATFKDGTALTPLVVRALSELPPTLQPEDACGRGVAYLASKARADHSIETGQYGLSYPAYTSAGAVLVLSCPEYGKYRQARDAWLTFLRERQLAEDLGWQPDDEPYGGWGYCSGLPRKLKPGEFGPSFIESNLSATLFALQALRASGCPVGDPAIQKALIFVQRCQNFVPQGAARDAVLDDGGFFFIYDDPVRNKAGRSGKDAAGHDRFYSYGSTTADGVRALLACGVPMEDERLVAARNWLETHFRADTHPGTYEKDRELNRLAIYYYYCASTAEALHLLGGDQLSTSQGECQWAEKLVDALLQRQRPDGSWQNPCHAFREDEPLLATAQAVLALVTCQSSIGD